MLLCEVLVRGVLVLRGVLLLRGRRLLRGVLLLVQLVVEVVLLQLRLSSRSFSAAMARTSR